MKAISLALVLLFTLQLNAQKAKKRTVTIEPNLSFENYEHFKRLILKSPDSHVEHLEGFEFEWGYRYKVKVMETKLSSTLSDGTQYEYSFVEVEKKEAVEDTVFRLFIDPNRYYYEVPEDEQSMNVTIVRVNDSIYRYFDKVDIIVPVNLRENMDQVMSSKDGKLGYFRFENGRIRLVKF